MRLVFQLLLLLCFTTMLTYGQIDRLPSLNFGDPAPPLQELTWLKGKPLERFEMGKVYVVEFWATWCIPCIAAMPRLSKLARKYKKKIVVIGIDVLEEKTTPMNMVKAFVDSMGHRIKFPVAAENSHFM